MWRNTIERARWWVARRATDSEVCTGGAGKDHGHVRGIDQAPFVTAGEDGVVRAGGARTQRGVVS